MNKLKVYTILAFCLLVIFSCDQDIDKSESSARLNTFKMTLNEKIWTPSDIDECTSTFNCQMAVGLKPFYRIKAYWDPQLIADLSSENFFELQILDVEHPDSYTMNGTFGDYENYARLTINDASGKKVYENIENGTSFTVKITRIYPPMEGSEVVGIRGSFEGCLYNRDNPLDFIRIDQGHFDFQKLNWSNFNQCREW